MNCELGGGGVGEDDFGDEEREEAKKVELLSARRDAEAEDTGEMIIAEEATAGQITEADQERMAFRMKDERKEGEFEPLTSMADSTMKDNSLGSSDPPENLELNCCIERVNTARNCSPIPLKDDKSDLRVSVPFETVFCNLVETVLRLLGYSDTDMVGARGMIVIKNWRPMALDVITDNPWAKAGEILGGLSTIITLKIYLCNSSKYGIMEDLKAKLLSFLLKHSQDVLQASGCPIRQNALKEILDDGSCLSEDMKQRFNDWYQGQVTRNRTVLNCSDSNRSSDGCHQAIVNGEVKKSEFLSACAKMVRRNPTLGKLWTENNGRRTKGHPSRKDNYRLKITSKYDQIPLKLPQELENQTWDSQKSSLLSGNGQKAFQSSRWAYDSTERLLTDSGGNMESEDNSKAKQRIGCDAEERVPNLPNKNAVYMIQPLPMLSSGSDSMEVVLSGSEPELDDCSSTPEPQDLSKTVCSSLANKNARADRNHNFFSRPADGRKDSPTNLILHDRTKSVGRDNRHEENVVNPVYAKYVSASTSEISKRIKSRENEKEEEKEDEEEEEEEEAADEEYDHFQHFDDLYPYKSEPCSPKLPPSLPTPFGILPHIQALHHHHQQQQQQQQQQRHHQHATSQLLAMSNTMSLMHHLHNTTLSIRQPFQDYIHGRMENSSSDGDHKKRSRVFIDPISETPKLEEWFAIDSHPSTASIEQFTSELNQSVYRQRFPKLEAKNVQLWFKNHRAKVKRLKCENAADSV